MSAKFSKFVREMTIEHSVAMTTALQEQCLHGRGECIVMRVSDGRIAAVDRMGRTIFVCKLEDLPTLDVNDISF